MIQISNKVFCDYFLQTAVIENKILPNPYRDYPFLIIENFLTAEESMVITSSIQTQSYEEKAKVKTKVFDSIVLSRVVEEVRKTALYTLPKVFEVLYKDRFLRYQKKIETFFAMGLTQSTALQVLVYKKGDFYIKHADDSSELIDKKGETIGFNCVAPERKLTTLLFGSSHIRKVSGEKNHFDGGELIFNYLYDEHGKPIIIYPKAGDMIVFPSNPFYSHEVKPVISGYRLTMVQWHNAL